jgi:alpha-beta hydrolase superfamily lysophospholipase
MACRRALDVARISAAILAAVCLCSLADCGGRLATRPGEFEVARQKVTMAKRDLAATYVKPEAPRHPERLVIFCTGDAGWMGVSGMVFERLAELGYHVAGYDAREMLKPVKESGKRVGISKTASWLDELFQQARKDLGLRETTPIIFVGYSRGASGAVLATLSQRLRPEIAGTIAIALTRESDYLRAPDPADRPPEIQVDEKERIQLYPAIALAGETPVAVIQSAGDSYVPAAEARKLLGPDTATRRLYEVEAKNHGFSGGRDALLRDLEDALQWIEKTAGDPGRSPAP